MRARSVALLVVALVAAGCTTTTHDGDVPGVQDNASHGSSRPSQGSQEPATRPNTTGEPARDTARIVHWRGDPGLSGHVPNVSVPDTIELDWRMRGFNKGTHTAAKGSAILVDDTLLVGADTGTLYRLTLDGEVLWAAATWPSSNGIHGTPAVRNDLVYIGSYEGALYAFALDTGHLVWRTQLGGSIGSSPIPYGDKVYVSVETPKPSGIFAVVDAETGELLHSDEDIADHPHSTPGLDPARERIVFGANDGLLYAWNLSTWERAWTFQTGGAIKGPILVHDGVAVFGSWDHNVYAVDVVDGSQVWLRATEDKVMSGAGYDPATDTVFIGSHDDHLYALDPATGEVRWRAATNGSIISSPTIAGDKVFVGSHDEDVYAFDTRTGKLVWHHDTGGLLSSSPLVWDGGIAVLDRADEGTGSLWVFRAAG